MTYYIFRIENARNRAYVIDLHGNKVYYGTIYQCRKFVNHMTAGADQEGGPGCYGKKLESNRETVR